jgi:hypothetical protein
VVCEHQGATAANIEVIAKLLAARGS